MAALKAAGAILIGKANMHELGLSTIGINPHYGLCRNPWQTQHVCGGSSSGVVLALAVAAAGSVACMQDS